MLFLKAVFLRASRRFGGNARGRFLDCFRDEIKKMLQRLVPILFLRAGLLVFHPEFVLVIHMMRKVFAKPPFFEWLQGQVVNLYPHMNFGRTMVAILPSRAP